MNLLLCLLPLLAVGGGRWLFDCGHAEVALQEFGFQVFCEEMNKKKELGYVQVHKN